MARMGSNKSHSRYLRGNVGALIVRVEADGTGGISVPNSGGAREIIGIRAVAKATSASGDATVSVGGNDVGTVTMAANDAAEVAASIDSTYSLVGAGEMVTVTTNGANDRGIVVIEMVEA